MSEMHPFHDLLPKHAPELHRRALKLTGNQHRAEDLLQETLLKAWTHRDRFEPGSKMRAWLFTILRNTFFSDLRKYRYEVQNVDDLGDDALSEEPRQESTLALKELMSLIARLPDAQIRPLLLMGAYGYSQLEAADMCGCTVGTIKSRVSRSRATLNRILEREGEQDCAPGRRTRPISHPVAATRHGPKPALIGNRTGPH